MTLLQECLRGAAVILSPVWAAVIIGAVCWVVSRIRGKKEERNED